MQDKKALSGSTLKWIAIVAMLMDHIGAGLIEGVLMNLHGTSWMVNVPISFSDLWKIDRVLRYVGRISFPIFCFLLVEGALHTRDIRKYGLRLAIFALISELPFDLGIYGQLSWERQNVFFTLFLGLLVIYIYMRVTSPLERLGLAIALATLAEIARVDYGACGVVLILLLYEFRNQPGSRFLAGMGILLLNSKMEITAALAFVLMSLYNGERGRQPRYFFYAFYPAHLLLIWAVGRFLLPVFL